MQASIDLAEYLALKARAEQNWPTVEEEAYARLVSDLLAALHHACEALAWHDGLAFEMNGRTADYVIRAAIAEAERFGAAANLSAKPE